MLPHAGFSPVQTMLLRFLVRVVFYSLLGWFVLTANPFDIGDRADQASQDAFYKVIAPLYDSSAREDIVVVLLDTDSIDQLFDWGAIKANEWPILYQDHAYLLSRVIKYQPKAIFVDIYFKKKRVTDPSFDLFYKRIEHYSEKYRVPLLFAGGYASEQENYSGIQQELESLSALTINGWRGYGSAYPIKDHDRWTAAFDLSRIACLQGEPLTACSGDVLEEAAVRDGDAMSVNWGSLPAVAVFPEFLRDSCAPASHPGIDMARRFFLGLLKDINPFGKDNGEDRVTCPYHPVIYASQIVHVDKQGSEEQKARLKSALGNRIVMYGITLEGLHDLVTSPVHGQLPGVYMHAMALDNLLLYGEDYIRASDERSEVVNLWLWIIIVLTISSVLLFLEKSGVSFSDKGAGKEKEVVKKMEAASANMISIKARLYIMSSPRFFILALATTMVFVMAIVMFSLFDYEPVNSIGFLVLSGVVAQLVHNDTAEKIISTGSRIVQGCRRRFNSR